MKPLAAITTAILAVGLAVVGVAAPASAHNATITGSAVCTTSDGSAVVTWTVTNDYPEEMVVTKSNNSAIPVNSSVVATNGHGTTSKTFTQTIPAPAAGVTASVTLDFKWIGDNYTQTNKSASAKVSSNCKVPATTVTPAAVTFAPAACTTPGNYGQGSYTIPTKTGVQYQIKKSYNNWDDVAAGTKLVDVGTTVTIRAIAASSAYTLTGTQQWSQQIAAPSGTCDVAVTAGVTFADAVCTGPGTSATTGSYTIPTTTGVTYAKWGSWNWDTWSNWNPIVAGTYTVNVGDSVTIKALVSDGYTLTGTATWTHEFVSAGACLSSVIPATVAFTDSVCTGPGTQGQGSYTITAKTGVIYQINGTTVGAGTVKVNAGASVTITAVAAQGYTLTGTATWTHEFASAGACLVSVTVSPATMVDNTCTTAATLTLPSITGVLWTVNGGSSATPAGTYPMNAGGPNTVVASAATGYTLTAPYSESFTFAPVVTCVTPVGPTFAAASCDASTGVITGGSITIPATTGVSYYIDGLDAAAGPHTVTDGAHTVTAVADANYKLLGDTISWPVTIEGAGECHAPLTIDTDPEAVQPVCVLGDSATVVSGYITVAVTDHVKYSITGTTADNAAVSLTDVGARTDLPAGVYTVMAVADPGYVLAENDGPTWPLTITAFTGDCQLVTLAPIPTGVTSTNQVCTAGNATGGTITVGHVEDADFFNVGIDYFINGTKVTSQTTTVPAGTYTVTAVADPNGDASIQDGDASEWTITIAAPSTDCAQLKTLAFTGADGSMGGMLIFALFLLLGGAGVYTASRFRSRES